MSPALAGRFFTTSATRGAHNIRTPNRKSRRRHWHPTPVLLPGKSHGRRSLVGCGPWGRWESDTTERLHFHFSLSCIGEGNGNPLQYSCLENPRDGGARWAAIYGVTQSRTRLTWLSSSSSSNRKSKTDYCKHCWVLYQGLKIHRPSGPRSVTQTTGEAGAVPRGWRELCKLVRMYLFF